MILQRLLILWTWRSYRGYDAIVVANGDNSAEPAIKEAAAKGVPLINYDSALAGIFYAQVMSSNKQMGKNAWGLCRPADYRG